MPEFLVIAVSLVPVMPDSAKLSKHQRQSGLRVNGALRQQSTYRPDWLKPWLAGVAFR